MANVFECRSVFPAVCISCIWNVGTRKLTRYETAIAKERQNVPQSN